MDVSDNWEELTHDQKMRIMQRESDADIARYYLPSGWDESDFKREIAKLRKLWNPENLGDQRTAGDAPRKDNLIGAYRDLSRVEAILELIDNSIDVWMRRKDIYPAVTAETLRIYIDIEKDTSILNFEDNAGGVEEENLANLVIPGYSETSDTESIIGSYRTGGKKAIFKLASDVNIKTRYWNPAETSDEAFEIHLEKDWLEHPTEYRFPYFPLKNKSVLNKGVTRYVFRLVDANWNQNVTDHIRSELSRTYTLFLIRNPNIQIYFNNRKTPIEVLDDLYKFSGTYDGKKDSELDLRPQRIQFKCEQEWKGTMYPVTVEMVLGCRTTTSAGTGNDIWGIDFYGNNRLFMHHVQDEFIKWYPSLLPKGAVRQIMRGFVNFHGPNVFIPWDTHKRHLNPDRPLVEILKTDKYIKEFIEAWGEVYKAVSGSEAVKKTIDNPVKPWRKGNDISIPTSNEITLKASRRNVYLPESIHKPIAPQPKKASDKGIEIKFDVTKEEFKNLCEKANLDYKEDRYTKKLLTEKIKKALLRLKSI